MSGRGGGRFGGKNVEFFIWEYKIGNLIFGRIENLKFRKMEMFDSMRAKLANFNRFVTINLF